MITYMLTLIRAGTLACHQMAIPMLLRPVVHPSHLNNEPSERGWFIISKVIASDRA